MCSKTRLLNIPSPNKERTTSGEPGLNATFLGVGHGRLPSFLSAAWYSAALGLPAARCRCPQCTQIDASLRHDAGTLHLAVFLALAEDAP